MSRPAPITCYPVLAPPPPHCECTEEPPEKHQSAPVRVECAEKMPDDGGIGVGVTFGQCHQIERKLSRSWTRTSAEAGGKSETVADLPRARVGCVQGACRRTGDQSCYQTRDQMTERRDVNICLPPPRPVEIPAYQPKLDLHFDPNPFRGKCDGRAIRLLVLVT